MTGRPALLLARLLRAPETDQGHTPATWSAILRCARHEGLAGALAHRLRETGRWNDVPDQVRAILRNAEIDVAHGHTRATWRARGIGRLLRDVGCPLILLKGTAYVAAGRQAANGRSAGDLDILVPRSWLGAVEARLADAGWRIVATDPYDIAYYRQWMHELPPMVHETRGGELDVHHTILPLTHRLRPDAAALVAAAQPLPDSDWRVLCPADMVLHSAVHLFCDGEFTKGLRNLWDLHQLLMEFGRDRRFWDDLVTRARLHGLERPAAYALRYTQRLFHTRVEAGALAALQPALPDGAARALMDALVLTTLASAGPDTPGPAARAARFLLYVRSHWLKMPPALLARHLWTKWRKRRRGNAKG